MATNGFRSAFMSDRRGAMILFIFVGSIPTGIIGFLCKERLEAMSSSIPFVCIALAITGGIVFSTRYIERMKIRKQGLSITTALLIGFAQGVAITPGISRSGSTISTGMWVGLDRRASGEFSFLLSLPAIMGALILEMRDIADASAASIPGLLAGFFAAFFTGWAALMLLLRFIRGGRLHLFAVYCWIVAAVAFSAWLVGMR